jgi:hypothetical protein
MKKFPNRLLSLCLVGLGTASPVLSQANGICDPAEAQQGLCWLAPWGYVIEAVTGSDGEFPVINSQGNSVFSYLVTGPGAGHCNGVPSISHASVLLPSSCAAGDLVILQASPAPQLQTHGQGDPSCGFGVGDLQQDVLKWDLGVACNSTSVYTLVIEGEVPAALTSFSFKAGPHCEQGTILGPACPNIKRYCPSSLNSTGQAAVIDFDGSFSISANDFSILGAGLPPNQPGFYFYGTVQTNVPFGNGLRCVGGPSLRLEKIGIPFSGDTLHQFDLTAPPLDTVVPGVPYFFQLYYRDPLAGNQGFNTTNALAIVFTP